MAPFPFYFANVMVECCELLVKPLAPCVPYLSHLLIPDTYLLSSDEALKIRDCLYVPLEGWFTSPDRVLESLQDCFPKDATHYFACLMWQCVYWYNTNSNQTSRVQAFEDMACEYGYTGAFCPPHVFVLRNELVECHRLFQRTPKVFARGFVKKLMVVVEQIKKHATTLEEYVLPVAEMCAQALLEAGSHDARDIAMYCVLQNVACVGLATILSNRELFLPVVRSIAEEYNKGNTFDVHTEYVLKYLQCDMELYSQVYCRESRFQYDDVYEKTKVFVDANVARF